MKRISILVTVLMGGLAYGAAPMHGGHPGRPGHVERPVHVVRPIQVVRSVPPMHHVEPTFFYLYGAEYADGVTYSPYALEYGSSGLVPGYMRYSPYALEYGKSGLISDNVQYSPYALGSQHGGLNSDIPYGYQPYTAAGCGYGAAGGQSPGSQELGWPYRGPWPPPSGAEIQGGKTEQDQQRVIRDYLDRTCPGRFEITRLLCVDNQAVCFDVVLKDKNVIVKYWNCKKVESINREADYRQKALTNYMVDWLDYRDRFEAKGGKVYHIASEDTYELLNGLSACLHTDNS
jgi:hypothetical protein